MEVSIKELGAYINSGKALVQTIKKMGEFLSIPLDKKRAVLRCRHSSNPIVSAVEFYGSGGEEIIETQSKEHRGGPRADVDVGLPKLVNAE